jgi:hypothetical protein
VPLSLPEAEARNKYLTWYVNSIKHPRGMS